MGSRRRPASVLSTILAGVLLAGCGGSGGSSTTTPQPGTSGDAAASSGVVGATTEPMTPSASAGRSSGDPGRGGSPSQVVTGTAGATGTGAPVPWSVPPTAMPTNPPKAPSGTAKLSILLDNGFGVRTTWTLTCEPAGGTHPDPALACGVLGASGVKALPEPNAGQACTEQYGGPQKARLTGTWRGKPVDAQLSLENGCQIARWEALLGLLPPGGMTG